jgi:Tol biopolymer transport system component
MPGINHLRLAAMMAAVLLTAGVLALVGTRPAEAAFPGSNGKIAFSSNRVTTNNPTGDFEIFIMNPDGTGIEQLTSNTAADYDPAFSADGSKLAWTSQQDGNPEIYVRFFFGGTPVMRRLTTSAGTEESAPSFSPDASKIAFDRMPANASDSREIYVMDTTDSNDDGNGDNQTALTNNTVEDLSPAWSPNGEKIAFVSEVGSGEVFVMDTNPATNDATNLTNNPAYDVEPNWSPDGHKIAFASQARDISNPNNTDIYVMNALDGSEQKRLTKKAAIDRMPAFSPSGTRIAFMSFRGGDSEIFVMKSRPESRKNRPKNLTKNDGVSDFQPDWQPIPQP